MQTFSDMLRQLLSANHYTAYQLAQLSGVNRTTIQRALTSDRCPQKSAFEKLAVSLNLTPEEKELFYAAYERAAEGDFHYFCRKHVKQLLENTESVALLMEKPIKLKQSVSLEAPVPYNSLTHGFYNICRLFKILVSQETKKNEKPELSLAFPSDNQLFDQFFQDLDSYDASHFSIRHLIFLARNPAILKDHRNYNLNLLTNLLPLMLEKGSDYEIHYMYRNYTMKDTNYSIFPYYILFSDCALMFSSDLNTVWLEQEPELIAYLKTRFNDIFEQSSRLLQAIPIHQQFRDRTKGSEISKFIYSMGYQPSFSDLLDENLCKSITNLDLPDNASLLELLLLYNKKLPDLHNNINIFHEKSLEEFIHYGIIKPAPPSFFKTLNKKERLQLLTALYSACQNDTPVTRIVNPLAFSLSQNFVMNVTGKNCVEMYFYNQAKQEYHIIRILENTLFETFSDFLLYLPRSTMVYDRDTTLGMIEKYRLQLECMIE